MYYTVQPGDTLYSIAARYGTTVQALLQANGLTDANYIYSGLRLYIPIPVPIPIPSPYPPGPPSPPADRELERRVNRLEREVQRLSNEVERLDRRVDRLERQRPSQG